MRRYTGRDALTRDAFRRPAVTVGMFDGMHRGHRLVIEELQAMAAGWGGETVVVTFPVHPMAVITGAPPRRLQATEQRLERLARLGVDATVLLPFDEALRGMSYERFLTACLIGELGLRGLLFGYNSNFGHGGRGTYLTVAPLAEQHGFDLREAPPVLLDGRPISSTRIRDAIEAGALQHAADMLGRPVVLWGEVVPGEGRGRQLGFPTANVSLEAEVVPPHGVYEVILIDGAEHRRAAANWGKRPTVGEDGTPVLEVHVPGWSGDLYGRRVGVELVRKLRDEMRFESVEALRAQIAKDVAQLGSDSSPTNH